MLLPPTIQTDKPGWWPVDGGMSQNPEAWRGLQVALPVWDGPGRIHNVGPTGGYLEPNPTGGDGRATPIGTEVGRALHMHDGAENVGLTSPNSPGIVDLAAADPFAVAVLTRVRLGTSDNWSPVFAFDNVQEAVDGRQFALGRQSSGNQLAWACWGETSGEIFMAQATTVPEEEWHWWIARHDGGGEYEFETYDLSGCLIWSESFSFEIPAMAMQHIAVNGYWFAGGRLDQDFGGMYVWRGTRTADDVRSMLYPDPWAPVRWRVIVSGDGAGGVLTGSAVVQAAASASCGGAVRRSGSASVSAASLAAAGGGVLRSGSAAVSATAANQAAGRLTLAGAASALARATASAVGDVGGVTTGVGEALATTTATAAGGVRRRGSGTAQALSSTLVSGAVTRGASATAGGVATATGSGLVIRGAGAQATATSTSGASGSLILRGSASVLVTATASAAGAIPGEVPPLPGRVVGGQPQFLLRFE